MKIFYFFLPVIGIALFSCMKSNNSCQNKDPQEEVPAMQAFCLTNGIEASVDSFTIYSQVIEQGTGNAVKDNKDTVIASYTIKLMNGTTIGQVDSATRDLRYYDTPGLQWGIIKVNGGGHVKLVVPSYLAYGCNGANDRNGNLIVPANSPIYYDVKVWDVRNYKQ